MRLQASEEAVEPTTGPGVEYPSWTLRQLAVLAIFFPGDRSSCVSSALGLQAMILQTSADVDGKDGINMVR